MLRILSACICILFAIGGSLSAQTPFVNPVKKALKEGKPVIGATITTASPDVAATLASSGFDFLWIEMEHSPLTLETVRSMILARCRQSGRRVSF